ncbi:neprilysin-1-like isoform X7 [Dermacentor albipictus]|uniref:neprilysin-1-like isoform X7 n=1 Tax=Dermacentor albipictus TaxID=60249 RepID=UPI0031FCA8DE
MNAKPPPQPPPKAAASNRNSQKDGRTDCRRNETSLLVVCLAGVILGALVSGLVMALLSTAESSMSTRTNDSAGNPFVCTTNDCKALTQWLRVKLDQKVDPCDDFYKFVCDDYSDEAALNKMIFEIARIAQSAAHATTVPATGQSAWQKAVALFKSCMSMVTSKRDETKELTAWMTSLGLDLNNLTASDQFDGVDMLVRLSLDIGIPVFISLLLDNDTVVNNRRLVHLSINNADTNWLIMRQTILQTSPKENRRIHLMLLQKYGVDSSHIRRLSVEINRYENQLTSILEKINLTEDNVAVVRGPIQDMGALTKPVVTGVISKETFMAANEMASNIRKAYQVAFQSSSWMTGSLRETALRKITNMQHHIGAMGAPLDSAYVEKYYANFPDLPTDRFFKAWREATAAAIHQAWTDTTMLLHSATEVTANYRPYTNTMIIPASILLPNTFLPDGPAAFNYGSIGTIIAHEMMHGYDVKGSQYDENAKERHWLSPESANHYVNRMMCLRHFHKDEESNGSSQKEDRVDGRRYMASLLFLCLIGVVPGALASGLATALFISSPSSVSPATNDSAAKPLPCTTNDCNHLAQWLRVKIDQKVDPCHDFYEFVCDDYKRETSLRKLTQEIARIGKSVVRTTTVPATGQTAWQKAAALFKACLTMVDSKRDETKDLITWMTSLGLDLNNLTRSHQFDPLDVVVRLSLDFGAPVLLSFTFHPIIVVNKKRYVILNLNEADMQRLMYLANAGMRGTIGPTSKLLQKYGVHSRRLALLQARIIEYEQQLLSILASIAGTKGATEVVNGSIEDMGKVTEPVISGEMWAGSIAKYTNGLYQGGDTIRYVKLAPLFLANALKWKHVASPGLRCYIAWSLFGQMINYTDPDLLAKDKNPEDVCYGHANRLMGYAITSRFFNSVISKKTFVEVKAMASNIRKAYKAAFRSSTWMTRSVRRTALRKITNMRPHIGVIGALLDGGYVEKYYARIPDLPTDHFFKAWREAAAAAIHQAWADSTMILNKETEANAFYLTKFNMIFVLPSILLPNILFTDGPAAFNYGSLGTIIGHEIMHGYDVNGSQYDENAKLRRWLSPESTEHYVNSTLCLRDFHVDVLRRKQEVLNDTVDSENLADLVGTTMAYSAFRSLPPSKRDTTLPGVTMTPNQLFFVGHCTPWCETQTTQPAPWLSGRNRYAPGRSRCIVPLMNMPEFSDAFNCKLGSDMNPPNKCNFWI